MAIGIPAETVLTGTAVYVIGQLVSKLFVEPLNEWRVALGEVASTLLYWANVYSNPAVRTGPEGDPARNKACEEIRRLAGLIRVKSRAVPGYRVLAIVGLAPLQKDVEEAAKQLTFLSNSLYMQPNEQGNRPLENIASSNKVSVLLKLGLII